MFSCFYGTKEIEETLEISQEELQKKIKKDDDFIENEFLEIFDEELAKEHLESFLKLNGLTLGSEFNESDDSESEYEKVYYVGKIVENQEKFTILEQENVKIFCKKYNLIKPGFIRVYI